VEIRNRTVAGASVDLAMTRFNGHVAVNILPREGEVEIVPAQ
jgi:hypothetical protein